MNGKVIDSNFILNVNPDWSYGRNHGFMDDETEKIADDTYWEMERFYEKYRPHKWPEEKPEFGIEKKYIVRIEYEENGKIVSETETDKWTGFTWYEFLEDYITHWWDLPEVTE